MDVDELELSPRGGEAVQRGDVDDGVASGDCTAQPAGVEEVDPLVPDVVPLLTQLAGDVPADEAARTCDVDLQLEASLLPDGGRDRTGHFRRDAVIAITTRWVRSPSRSR